MPTLVASAQTNYRDTADSLFTNYNYSAAASCYLRCENDTDSITIFRKLAQCYRKMGDYKAEQSSLLRIPQDSLLHNDMRQIYYSYSRLQDTVSIDLWGKGILEAFPYDSDITASVAADMMEKGDIYGKSHKSP